METSTFEETLSLSEWNAEKVLDSLMDSQSSTPAVSETQRFAEIVVHPPDLPSQSPVGLLKRFLDTSHPLDGYHQKTKKRKEKLTSFGKNIRNWNPFELLVTI